MPNHLIIGDPHAHYNFDNDRFTIAGRFVVDRRPDVVICMGDWADMASLSHYDKGKLSYEGRAYQRDIEAAIDAQEKFFAPIRAHNRRARRQTRLNIRFVMIMGNHDQARIEREVEENPGLRGKLSIDDLRYREYGWEVYPFLQPAIIDTIAYCHYFVSGVASRPISGESIARTLCNKLHASSVVGHSHLYDHAERAIINGKKIFGLSAGCFVHPGYIENWNRATEYLWWRGIVELIEIDGAGYYDQIRATTLRKLIREYA